MSIEIADKMRALGISIPYGKSGGNMKVPCPKCGPSRRNKKDPSLSVDLDSGAYRCHNTPCDFKGWATDSKYVPQEKVYKRPEPINITPLHPTVVEWFKSRGISQQTLLRRKIADGIEWMPPSKEAPHGEMHVIKFPYYEHGELVNIKYRSHDKRFKQFSGAKLIMSNLDAIKDQTWCIIVEGEIDDLTYDEAGFGNYVTSVPSGTSDRGELKLEYLDNCWQYFENKEKIIISVDDDVAGRLLKDELIRRLGPERCYTVSYGYPFKDINEFVIGKTENGSHFPGNGILKVEEVIKNAQPCPLIGVYEANYLSQGVYDLHSQGMPPGDRIGIRDSDTNDELVSFLLGQLTVVTGMPNSGKSDGLDQIIVKLAIMHGWKFAIYSPENYPTKIHVAKIIEKITGKHFTNIHTSIGRVSPEDIERCISFIQEHFYWIIPDEENASLDDILSTAKQMLRRYGVKGLVIDPWNTLEHNKPASMNEADYVSKSLGKIVSFDRKNSIHTFLVAHPGKPKEKKKDGSYPPPTLYDISGGANFFNKADNGITFHRNYKDGTTLMIINKIKYKHQGKVGTVKYRYDVLNGRFHEINSGNDTKDWLRDGFISVGQNAINFSADTSTDPPPPVITEDIVIGSNSEYEGEPF